MAPKKVLITGATGYLGSHLVRRFVELGYEVIAIKRNTSDTRRLCGPYATLRVYDLDRCDVKRVLEEHPAINVIIHTATCYGRKAETPSTIAATNTIFPLQIIEAANHTLPPLFINADTVLPEDANAYSLSKAHFREWGEWFAKRGKVRFVNVRLQHFYGPRDDISKFTAQVIQSCIKDVPELLLTKGEQQRDFIFIDDVVSAFECLVDRAGENIVESYDVGSGTGVTVREFVERVRKSTGASTRLNFGALEYRQWDHRDYIANTAHIEALGWTCKTSLAEGIRRTVIAESEEALRQTLRGTQLQDVDG